MVDVFQPERLGSSTVIGSDGKKIGKVGAVYIGNSSGRAEFVTVKTGLFGSKESFVPLTNAANGTEADEVTVPYDTHRVKDAPAIEADGQLSPAEETEIYRYYGIDATGAGAPEGAPVTGQRSPAAAPTPVPTDPGAKHLSDDGGQAMTRSEERLRVGTEQVETGQARLRKYVVTEEVNQTVPVSRERVVVEHEPITDANRGAVSGQSIGEAEQVVTLHEERPVVAKETVAVEQVRLSTETETGKAQVHEQVRKEQIEEDIPGQDAKPRR